MSWWAGSPCWRMSTAAIHKTSVGSSCKPIWTLCQSFASRIATRILPGGRFGDLRIDFLFTKEKLFAAIRQQYATKNQFAERRVTCATVDGLLLMKLFALPDTYRRGQFDRVRLCEKDVADLIERYRPKMASILDELARHMLPSDLEEIRRIVAEIEDRIARQSQRFGPAAP